MPLRVAESTTRVQSAQIAVDEGTLVGSNEVVIVSGAEEAAATAALEAAGERFYAVDERGVEDDDDEPEVDEEGNEYYTPNYVSDVESTADGVRIYVDCKGEISPRMGETFVRILVEELQRHGVTSAHVFSPMS